MTQVNNEKIDPSELYNKAREAVGEELKGSLFHFARYALGYKDINNKTHGKIITSLEGDSKRKLICVPRGCLKSSLACVAYPIWKLLNNPNLRIFIDSELYSNSCTFIREIRAHLEAPLLTKIFGEFKSKTWNESELIINQRTKVYKEASLTAGGVGTRKIGQHYDIYIMDDMNSPDNTNTPEMAQKVIDHYRLATSILENNGVLLVIGTRYSNNDLIGHIIRNEIEQENKGLI
jgi:hypothetical protein